MTYDSDAIRRVRLARDCGLAEAKEILEGQYLHAKLNQLVVTRDPDTVVEILRALVDKVYRK